MISNVICHSEHLRVFSQYKEYVANNGHFSGQLRYNTQIQAIEVYDGIHWKSLNHNVIIEHTEHLAKVIAWVTEQMQLQSQYLELSSKHESVKHAYEKYLDSKKELDCVINLTK